MTKSVPVDTTVLRRALGHVIPFASDDETLPVLRSVHLSAATGILTTTATDRYALGRANVPAGVGELEPLHISLPDARHIRQCLKGTEGIVALTNTGTHLEVVSPVVTLRFPVSDLAFPDVEPMFDSWRNERTVDGVALGPNQLAKFAKVKAGWDAPVRMWFYGPEKPVHVRIGNEFVGVVMPVRVPADKLAVPPLGPVAEPVAGAA